MNLLLTALLWTLAEAAPPPDVSAVCSKLQSKYPELVIWDPVGCKGDETGASATTYKDALLDYFNAENSDNRAVCGFFPSNAEQVSFAVNTLNAYPSVKFALKSGGHNANLGFSSVDRGVLIAFRPNSQYAIPAPDGKTIDVGPGCKWEDVYTALEPLGRATVGGRLGDIGVMGFTLGGGLSYLSAQYGLACDNVVNYEAVLADGTIVNVNSTSHPELYFALCGGGNQFAIVTKMTLKAHEIGDHGTIWGGLRTYDIEKLPEIQAATVDFTANGKDPKAAIIPTVELVNAVGLHRAIIVFFFYDGPKPASDVFDKFNAITSTSDSTKSKSYMNLTQEAGAGNLKGLRTQLGVNTFPNMPERDMASFLDEHYKSIANDALNGLSHIFDNRMFSYAYQPMTRMIAQASKDAGGGNALNIVPEHGDRLWVDITLSWANRRCDKECPEFLAKMLDGLHDLHKQKYSGIRPTNYEEGDLSYVSYNPVFMNDAIYSQEVLQTYGNKSYERLKATHQKYDPNGFFATRQDGFKFT